MYSLIGIESIRHNSSPVVLFDKLPCLPTSISFNQKVCSLKIRICKKKNVNLFKGELSIFINVDGTMIYLLNLLNNQIKHFQITKQNLAYHEKITCAQIHPHEECFALGTQSGRIALW